MEFRQLNTFIYVAHFQSFSKAAEHLGYTQSAVTVQIRLLEEELHTRLFERMGKRVSLTEKGKQLFTHAHKIIYEVQQTKYQMNDEEEYKNPLHIGTIESLGTSKLPSIVSHFRKQHPKVAIQITIASPEELIEKMEHNELDLIYILDSQRWNENWNKVMEEVEPVVFVTSPSLELPEKGKVQIDELLHKPFFLTEKDANYRQALDKTLAEKQRSLEPFIESSDTAFIIKILEENEGVSFLPYFAVEQDIKKGKLRLLDVEDVNISMYRQIFYHKYKVKTREMEKFIELAQLDIEKHK